MAKPVQPDPPTPPTCQPPSGQRSLSLDVGEASLTLSTSSTPSIPSSSDGCQPPSEEHSIQSSISSPNSPATVNVKFAPLPKIGPRDVRSNRPLGVAARSRMLQQKRDPRMQGAQRQSRTWSDCDDGHDHLIPDEAREEDPLEVFGRFIGAKSKSLWRRVSSKGKQSRKDETGRVVSGSTADGEEQTPFAQSRPPNRERLPSSSDPPNPNEAPQGGISKNKNDHMVRISSQHAS